MHIPGLQCLGGGLVLHHLLDALMDAHHVFDILIFLAPDLLLARQVGKIALLLLA